MLSDISKLVTIFNPSLSPFIKEYYFSCIFTSQPLKKELSTFKESNYVVPLGLSGFLESVKSNPFGNSDNITTVCVGGVSASIHTG